uniref:ribonucleoside-diphosphate reductase n=1 Tax=Otarine gammaherpesvirus 4 TaxID=2801541 RepID=A0A889IW30_9GAMA|nr:Ribonucleotide reductase small subunit [Otarine gammaherpesvirus 4]
MINKRSCVTMDCVRKFLYACDHEGFHKLTLETFQNRWLPSHINLTHDVRNLVELCPRDIEFYKFLFTFLGMAEGLVNFNITELLSHFSGHDFQHYYAEQVAMENVHAKTYANILNLFFHGNVGDTYAYAESVLADEALDAKIKWLNGRVHKADSRAEKVLIFLLVEGIFFTSSFYSIAVLRARGIMPGVCMANDYISRDEMMHMRAAAVLYKTMVPDVEKPPTVWIYNLFREAVNVEHQFIAAKGEGVTLVNVSDIRQYLEAMADRILANIGLSALYGTEPPRACPLSYMGCVKNINFFERESTDYSAAIVNDL